MSAPRVTARDNRSESRIGRTCDSRPAHFKDAGALSRSVRLAAVWNCSASVARKRLDSTFRHAADIVVALMSAGKHDQLAHLMAPMDAALTAWAGPPPMPDAVVAAADADAGEDSAEARFHAHPSRETARAYVRALARQNLHSERLQAALIHQWEL